MPKVQRPYSPVNVAVSVQGRNARANVKVTVRTPRERKQGQPLKLLKFFHGNAKLDDGIFTFSLPAGYFCPFADLCLSKADRQTGRITDGPNTAFRCFSATNELRKSVRVARWHNAELLKGKSRGEMVQLILDSLSPYAGYVRLHVSGDFFNQPYFDAWLEVARRRPRTVFYGYTKSLPFWVARLGSIPGNVVLTASKGGRYDDLIERHGLRYAQVVYSEAQAEALGLGVDHDDSHAMQPGPSFALLIHGMQPAGSAAAKAVATLRARGEYGYGAKADARRLALAVVN